MLSESLFRMQILILIEFNYFEEVAVLSNLEIYDFTFQSSRFLMCKWHVARQNFHSNRSLPNILRMAQK